MAETTKRTVQLNILTTGLPTAEKDLAKLGRALKEAGDAAKGGGLSNALGGLNKSFMGAGITGDAGLIGLLRGGGAAAAGMFGADVIKGMAQAFIDVRDGAKDAAQAFRDAAESIPVLGSIFGAGGAIREAFTGEKAQLKLAEEVGKLIENHSKESRELSDRVNAVVQRERDKLNSVFGEKGSAVDAARRAYDDELGEIEKKFVDKLRTIGKDLEDIELARRGRSGYVSAGVGAAPIYVDAKYTDIEQNAKETLEQAQKILQKQREQVRRQLGELGDFAALREGQREQIDSFRKRLQRAGRDKTKPYELPDFGTEDRFGAGIREAHRESQATDRQSKAIEDLVAEVKQLVKALDPDRDSGAIGQLLELVEQAE